MITIEHLKDYLISLAEKHPLIVIERLNNGSRVQKSLKLFYKIDNTDIDLRLGTFAEGVFPYGPIHRKFRESRKEIYALFNGSSEIEFSKAYEAGIGECLEKSILAQLFAQRQKNSFLINGVIAEDGDFGGTQHGYNIIFIDSKPFLVDIQNPLAKGENGEITRPYFAPIIGVKGCYNDFLVEPEWRQKRNYSIF